MKLVKMIRERDGKEADVHPDEVKNWQSFDWKVCEEDKPKRGRPPKAKDAN